MSLKNKWVGAVLAGALGLGAAAFGQPVEPVHAAVSNHVAIKVNGAVLVSDDSAFVERNRVMVPLRAVSEAMGAKVKWDSVRKTVRVTGDTHSFELAAGQKKAIKDGASIELDAAPVMKEGRLFIPLRFSAEGLGGTVRWNAAKREANIYPGLTPEQAKSAVKESADRVIRALRDQDFKQLAEMSHSKGVTFSPYAYVERTKNVTLSREKMAEGFANDAKYSWGEYDGSGEPIKLKFKDYYKQFVYSSDFARAPWTGFNDSKSYGNSLNNASQAYPGAVIVEYHFDGFNPEYGGMDWESLRLVFQKEGNRWVLSGIVHDEWTI
ncbi:copper amine oxidase N-terminal domain-containing protein [Paenibacillus sp. DMB20]|uniref:copper amine oxidase N-terminal domain-containing protein n=1 Tax=Paenibacillus sp. DMB20 TaxID=1642570 RepID=UPI000A75F880|nr:copper amine oxidase N-terminal domain-containing protein [Paenibacillus sp. DMB20]